MKDNLKNEEVTNKWKHSHHKYKENQSMRRIERTHLNWFIASPNAEAPIINTLSGIPNCLFKPLTSMTSDRVINASTMCVHLYSYDS